MLNNLPWLADYPFPVAFQTRLYVMAAHLWAQVQDMTMSDIQSTGAAYYGQGLKLGLALTSMHDLFGHIVDVETRLSNHAEAHKLRFKPWSDMPCFMAVAVFADRYSFSEAFADLVERH